MKRVKLGAVLLIFLAGTLEASSVEMYKPYEVLEEAQRDRVALEQRQTREAAERQTQPKKQQATGRRGEAEQATRDRSKAQKATKTKRDAPTTTGSIGVVPAAAASPKPPAASGQAQSQTSPAVPPVKPPVAAALVPAPAATHAEQGGPGSTPVLHPSGPHHLPAFITAPGETDVLMIGVAVFLVLAVLGVGILFLRLHTLPERIAHKSHKLQFEVVAVLGLLALFTHSHIFWVAGLMLALIDIPDFGNPLRRMSASLERIADRKPTPDGTDPDLGLEAPSGEPPREGHATNVKPLMPKEWAHA